MAVKEFKTYSDQIAILEKRGLIISNRPYAELILKKENYYNVINGYKDLFLKQGTQDEEYITGAKFEEIYALYNFDREIRNIFLKKILIFENNIKSIIAYEFSKRFGYDDYLKLYNFDNSSLDNIGNIMNLTAGIHSDIARQITKDNSLAHYLENHGYIPLWVLVKILTLGRISRFYSLMKEQDRRKVSQEITSQYQILEGHLFSFLKLLSLFRNLCAHEERMYNFKSVKRNSQPQNIPMTIIHTNLNTTGNRNGLFDLVICLKLLLEKEQFDILFNKLETSITKLTGELSSISIDLVLNKMNFPNNWQDIQNY